MRELTREGKKNPLVRQTAVVLTQGLEQKDHIGEIKALFNFVKNRIRYVRDIRGVETLHTPEVLLKLKQGDCDDKSILLASLLESLGFQTRFIAVGFQPPVKNMFGNLQAQGYSHVFPEVYLKGKWIPLETTEPVELGWSPKNTQSALIVYNGDNLAVLNALGKKKKTSRKEIYFEKLAADLEQAFVIAESEEATKEDIEKVEQLQKFYEASIANYEAGARRKKKGLIPRLIKLQEKKLKLFAKLKLPTFGTHVKHAERKKRAQEIKLEVMLLRGQRASPERDKKLAELSIEMNGIAKKEKQYMKDGAIVATIVSVVIGIFTFGAGGVAVQGAFQALRQGAVQLAKSILMSAVMAAIKNGASKKDTDEAMQVANDLEKYPPDPNLNSFDAMLADSQRKKLEAQGKQTSWILPIGLITALTMF